MITRHNPYALLVNPDEPVRDVWDMGDDPVPEIGARVTLDGSMAGEWEVYSRAPDTDRWGTPFVRCLVRRPA